MKRRTIAVSVGGVALAALAGALASSGRYAASTPALAAAFRAKEGCTCLFVHGRSEAECREWTRVSPDVAGMEVDRASSAVASRALLLWTARARRLSAREGCRLE